MKKGFTLIELLVVVLVIGILAAVAFPQYLKAVEKSRASEAFINVKALRNASDIYFLTHGGYPTEMSQVDVEVRDGKFFNYSLDDANGPRALRGGDSLNTADYWIHYVRKDYSDKNIAGKIICDAKQGYDQYCVSLGGVSYGATGYSAKRYILPS